MARDSTEVQDLIRLLHNASFLHENQVFFIREYLGFPTGLNTFPKEGKSDKNC